MTSTLFRLMRLAKWWDDVTKADVWFVRGHCGGPSIVASSRIDGTPPAIEVGWRQLKTPGVIGTRNTIGCSTKGPQNRFCGPVIQRVEIRARRQQVRRERLPHPESVVGEGTHRQ